MAGLKRLLQAMPETVRAALKKRGLTAAYETRPGHRRNDYLGWIAQAKREENKAKRLAQMLDELDCGGFHMNMAWRG